MATVFREPAFAPRLQYPTWLIAHSSEQMMNQNNLSLNTPLPIPQTSSEILWASSLY